jgi:pimeloyl-ACP methyl ester carboxylesterase
VEQSLRRVAALVPPPRANLVPDFGVFAPNALVLVGEGDQLIPLECSQELAKGIAGARLVVTPQCGHLSTLEQPEAVNRELEAWMSG